MKFRKNKQKTRATAWPFQKCRQAQLAPMSCEAPSPALLAIARRYTTGQPWIVVNERKTVEKQLQQKPKNNKQEHVQQISTKTTSISKQSKP